MTDHPIDADLARMVLTSETEFGIVTMDRGGVVTSWNPGAANIFGWSADDMLGQPVDRIFTPEDRHGGTPAKEMARALQDGRAVDERRHVRRDGAHFWASGLMMPLRKEGETEHRGFLKMVHDRSAERNAESRFHAMRMALPGFVFTTDTDGNNTETNERFQAYTGLPEQALLGDGWLRVLHEDDRARAAEIWAHAVATGSNYEARYRFRAHDGSYRCFACRGVPERDAEGRIVRWLGTCIDVENEARAHAALQRLSLNLEHSLTQRDADLATAIDELQSEIMERARAEEALRQSQKMEAVGQLTGGVAHDFNNFLTVIRASADLLRMPNLPEERRRRYIDAIAETADRAAALTGQLLAFARRQPLEPKLFDAAERLTALMPMLETTIGGRMTVALDVACGPCLIEADPNQYETAIVNLVANARDAMAGEGMLRIEVTEVDRLPPRRHHQAGEGKFIAVAVIDRGGGVAEENLTRIFEPFFTTKEVGKGTGLGLSQVFGFAKQSGGDVTVDSLPEQGTRFTLYLPKATGRTEPVPAASEPPAATPQPPTSRCVLVVEDNETVGDFAAQLLEELGHVTARVGSAQAALDTIRQAPDRIDLVFSDVVMPGMNGIDLAKRIRAEWPALPIILATGYSHVLVEEGTHGFELLRKPYSAKMLAAVLKRATA